MGVWPIQFTNVFMTMNQLILAPEIARNLIRALALVTPMASRTVDTLPLS